MQSADLARARNIVIWNKWFLNFLGVWPAKVNQPVFLLVSTYMIIYYAMAVNHLIQNFGNLALMVANLTDNVLIFMILGKIAICRRSSNTMTTFLESIETDFTTEMYNNVREKMAYLHYNKVALIFIRFSLSLGAFTAEAYYLKKLPEHWDSMMSGNFTYDELPYPVHPFFEIKDTTTYICICLYLAVMVPIILCGYGATDVFLISMAFHMCGQFAALSCKINNLLKDHENYHRHISSIILRHYHLIRLVEILENSFNMICLQQTLGTVLLLCLTLYHTISTSEYDTNSATKSNIVVFILYYLSVFSTIFAYCYTGECLIIESAGLSETFYNTDWYNNSPSHTKLIVICMIRADRPMMLTAGKFCALSLNMFVSIVKTSMAYLSMLRQFV